MTPEAQRIAIAESCPERFHLGEQGEVYFRGKDDVFIEWTDDNDLNAMHEAEKIFAIDDREYRSKLATVVGWPYKGALYNAAAAQRAEAFLRTLNLWVEPTTAPKGS
jgi:hypothetical protein